MKECNNCGYQKLLDNAKVCKCGAVEKPSFILAILAVMIKVAFITAIEVAILSFFWFMHYVFSQDVLFMLKSEFLFYSLLVIYIIQCVIYVIKYKTFHKEPNIITTTFKQIERREPYEATTRTYSSTNTNTYSKSNSDDNLLTGIVIGAVAAHILSSDDDSHNTRSSSNDDGYSDSCNDSGGDCGGGGGD